MSEKELAKVTAEAEIWQRTREREAVSQNLEKEYGSLSSASYDVFMGVADALVLYPFKKLGGDAAALAFLTTEKASSAIIDAKRRGLNDEQAITYGAINGGIDIILDKIPLEKLLNIQAPEILLSTIKNTFSKAGIDASAAFCSSVAISLYDCIVHIDQSKYQLRVQQLLDKGYTKEQAVKTTSNEFVTAHLKSGFTNVIIESLP